MPGLQFERLPADQVNQIKEPLHAQWRIEADALNKSWFSDRGKFETAKAKLNAKYQQMELTALTKLQQQVQERQQVQRLIQQPRQYTRAQEADIRMQLGAEAERQVFPKAPAERTPFSPTEVLSLARNIRGAAEAATQEPWYHRGKEKTRKSLIDQYLATVNMLRVSDPRAFGRARQQQFNAIWNREMSMDPAFANWFDKQGKPPVEMEIMAARGPAAEAVKKKAVGVSPIGQSLSKQRKWKIGGSILGPVVKPVREQAQPEQKPIRQRNKRTGQERISYDGGKTWQVIG